jgi:putative transposase
MRPANVSDLRLRLVERILHLPQQQLVEVEQLLRLSQKEDAPAAARTAHRDWPHAPLHRISEFGTYIVTAGTHQKEHFFRQPDRRDHLENQLLSLAKEAGWQVEAWAVFSNHYHFVGHATHHTETLDALLAELHRRTSLHVNELDQTEGRRVWFNYWETALTFERSYLARLNYVHQNAVRHRLVSVANQYPWCSAAWFERTATRAQVGTIYGFKIDKLNVHDDFVPI